MPQTTGRLARLPLFLLWLPLAASLLRCSSEPSQPLEPGVIQTSAGQAGQASSGQAGQGGASSGGAGSGGASQGGAGAGGAAQGGATQGGAAQGGAGSGDAGSGGAGSGGAAGQAGGAGQGEACWERTRDEKQCKDCCDCDASLGCEERVACRNTCKTFDKAHWSALSGSPLIEAPSALGPGGDYSACVKADTEQSCKACCECTGGLLCGDFRFCRDACAAAFGAAP